MSAATFAAVAAASLAGCGGAGRSERLRVVIDPASVSLGRSPSVDVRGLGDGERVEVTATTDRGDEVDRSRATFRAMPSGALSLGDAAPVGGTYEGMGSLALLGVENPVGRVRTAPSGKAIETTFRASAGNRSASARLVQRLPGPGIRTSSASASRDGFFGRYFTPARPRGHAAVLVWGGSEGGIADSERQAAALAANGIRALAVAYFDEPGLPCSLSRIPIGYFATAARWLARQPGVARDRVWAQSGSRGTEAELLLAAHWPGLLHGLIAAAPSAIGYSASAGRCRPPSPVAWTVHGRPVAHAFSGGPTLTKDGSYITRPGFLATLGITSTQAARIPVGGFRGPVLLLAGGRDEVWPSATFARQISRELHADPDAHRVAVYPAAGHIVLGVPSIPSPPTERLGRLTLDLGGTLAANDAAHRSDWAQVMRFVTTF